MRFAAALGSVLVKIIKKLNKWARYERSNREEHFRKWLIAPLLLPKYRVSVQCVV